MQKKISDSIAVALRTIHGISVKTSDARNNNQNPHDFIFSNQAYLFMRNIPGSPEPIGKVHVWSCSHGKNSLEYQLGSWLYRVLIWGEMKHCKNKKSLQKQEILQLLMKGFIIYTLHKNAQIFA